MSLPNPTSEDLSWYRAEMHPVVSCDQALPELSNCKLRQSGNRHYSLLLTLPADLWKWSVLPDLHKNMQEKTFHTFVCEASLH